MLRLPAHFCDHRCNSPDTDLVAAVSGKVEYHEQRLVEMTGAGNKDDRCQERGKVMQKLHKTAQVFVTGHGKPRDAPMADSDDPAFLSADLALPPTLLMRTSYPLDPVAR